MLSLRAHASIAGGLFATLIVFAVIGNVLQDQGIVAEDATIRIAARVLFFGLTLALFLSCVPLVVKLVLGAHVWLGHGDRPHIRRMLAHERIIVAAFWALTFAGLAVALPAAIQDGLFDPINDAGAQIARMPSMGTLVTRPGMPVAEMIRRSTLKLEGGKTVFAGAAIFTFAIADTAIRFPRCRYYFISYATGDNTRVGMMSIGAASRTMTLAEVDAADADLRSRLAVDGWQAGHEVYRDEQDRRLHGGLSEGPSGRMWLKGDTVMQINRRRMDDPKPDDPPNAGAWIQFVELDRRAQWPWVERYEFAPPKPKP